MKLWRRWAVLVGGLVLLAEEPAPAQSLNEVLADRLSNNCKGLSGAGTKNLPPNGVAGPNPDYGPQLVGLCGNSTDLPNSTGAASGGGGIIAAENRISLIAVEQRIRRRTQERRAAASADADRGFGLFFTTDYERFEKDNTRFETGFDRDTVGGTVGVDYVLSPSLLLGVAINYAHEFGDYDGGGGFDHDSYGVLVYTSLSPIPRAFVDIVAGYIRKNYDFERRAAIDILMPNRPPTVIKNIAGKTRAHTDSDEFRFSAYGGYDFVFDSITVGPRVGVNYRDTTIDGFRESGNTGIELSYDNQNVVSLTTNAGVYGSIASSTRFGVIVPQATVEYVHEFLNDQRSVGFSLVQDLARRRFLYQTDPPDRDYMNVAFGVSVVFPGGVTGFANFRELVGYRDRSSYAVSLGVRFPF